MPRKTISTETQAENPGGEKKKSPNANRTAKKAKRETFSTHDGHALTPQEAMFIDEYLISNGRQAVLKAYPNRNPKTAAQYAQVLLNNDYINSEIKFRMEQHKKESIASVDEILQYFTSVMRGELKDQFGLEASLGERTKAAQELAKRQIDAVNRLASTEVPEVVIRVDWTRHKKEETAEETDIDDCID